MALNLDDHQYAGDARIPFGFGGSGEGRVHVTSEWAAANLTINSQQKIFKVAKPCYVSNFKLRTDQLDTHATPTLTIDVGTDTDDDEFIAAATVGQTGGLELTNVVDESTEAGFPLAAGEYIIVSVKAAAATAAAGTVEVSFDIALA